jgi:diguanylate cyclase (GGDEF)-like protein
MTTRSSTAVYRPRRLAIDAVLWVGLAISVIATGGLAARSLSGLADAREVTTHGQLIDRALQDILTQLLDAESGQRGFLLSGKNIYLRSYYAGVMQLNESRKALSVAMGPNADSKGQVVALNSAIDAKLRELESTVDLKADGRSDEAMGLVLSDAGQQSMEAARDALTTIAAAQSRRTGVSRTGSEGELRNHYLLLATTLSLSGLLLTGLVWRSRRSATRSIAHNLDLARLLEISASRSDHVRSLSELNRFLHSCTDIDEAQLLLGDQLGPLMKSRNGALYILSASHNQMQHAFTWGDSPYSSRFAPSECWGLRLNQPYYQPPQFGAASCVHLHSDLAPAEGTVQCWPLVAQGELMGLVVLSIETIEAEGHAVTAVENEGYRREVLEQVALALGNLKLREMLRQQSIRDVLTGLYNRRFLEESLTRELQRAMREQAQDNYHGLALLMIDIDHFKSFNDLHGHEVGDFVLREVAAEIHRTTRVSDAAARYGGEEFTVILVNLTPAQAVERAEKLRSDVESLVLSSSGTAIGRVTISIGAAFFPGHGMSAEDLLGKADKALYVAKNAGRNQVAVAAPDAGSQEPERLEMI